MDVGALLPEIVLLVAAAFALLIAAFTSHTRQWLVAVTASAGLVGAGALCARQLTAAPQVAFAGTWAIDGASIWARLLILGVTLVTVLLGPAWFRSDRRHGEFYSMLLLAALGAMSMAAAASTLELVMGVLLSSVSGYALAAWHRDWPLSLETGMKYFLVGAFANTLLMLGVALLFGLLGTTDYAGMAAAMTHEPASPLFAVAVVMVVVGIAFKLGAAPAHMWLPDVAEGAPAPSAAILTTVPKVGAAIALFRLVTLFPAADQNWRIVIAVIAVATMTLGNLAALWQTDVRRLLGWSSVSQSGYALMAVTVAGLSSQALPALLMFLAGYVAANLAAFAVVAQLRGRTALADYDGLAARRPWLAAALTLSLFSLVGIPPLAGFAGKLELFVVTVDAGYAWLAAVAIANTVVSLFYYLRVIAPMYLREPGGTVFSLGRLAGCAVAVSGLAVIAIGLGAGAILLGFSQAARMAH